jgi:HD domain-containing protein
LRTGEPANLTSALPDPDRFGGLGWVARTDGRLSLLNRVNLVAAAFGTGARYAAHLLKRPFAKAPPEIDPARLKPPDSRLARAARDAIRDVGESIQEHSGRTWMLGMALATLDRCELDRELFYCAALLHDFGLDKPTKDHDFTLAGSKRACELAEATGIDEPKMKAIADGICVHPTVGISVPRDGAIGYYLQWGSMADIAGLRRSEVPKAIRDQILLSHRRGDNFKLDMISAVYREAKAMPRGRFAFYRWAGMTLVIRVAPDWRISGTAAA